VGVLVTLDLADDSPMTGLPWIITFGPNTDDSEWEPVVVGPYERAHALALAEEIVADEELMAVVEPLLPFTSTDEIRSAIADSIAIAEEEADTDEDSDYVDQLESSEFDLDDAELAEVESFDDEEAEEEDDDLDDEEADLEVTHVHSAAPSPDEVKAGMARIAAKLAATE